MSTQSLISSDLPGFGGVTIGDTHGVGPSTFSMMSSFSSSVCLNFYVERETEFGGEVVRLAVRWSQCIASH